MNCHYNQIAGGDRKGSDFFWKSEIFRYSTWKLFFWICEHAVRLISLLCKELQ